MIAWPQVRSVETSSGSLQPSKRQVGRFDGAAPLRNPFRFERMLPVGHQIWTPRPLQFRKAGAGGVAPMSDLKSCAVSLFRSGKQAWNVQIVVTQEWSGSQQRGLTMNHPASQPLDRALKRLGENVSKARRRRHWSLQDFAGQTRLSVSTLRRLEQGEPGIASHSLLSVLHALGVLDGFNRLLDADCDTIGILCQDERLPQRIRGSSSERAS